MKKATPDGEFLWQNYRTITEQFVSPRAFGKPDSRNITEQLRNNSFGVGLFNISAIIPWRPPGETVCLVVRSAFQRLAEGSAVRAPALSFPWRPLGALILLSGQALIPAKTPKRNRSHRRAEFQHLPSGLSCARVCSNTLGSMLRLHYSCAWTLLILLT